MYRSTQDFISILDEKKLRYTDKGTTDKGDDLLTVSFNTKNTSGVNVSFFFEENNKNVALRCFDLVKVPADKVTAMLPVINQQNAKFRFAKFVLDTNDNTIQAEADAIFRDHDVGEICHELMIRTVGICDDAYPEFMKAIWS